MARTGVGPAAWVNGCLVRVGQKTCGKCGIEKDIENDFGYRVMSDGSTHPQGWCKLCRTENKREVRKRGKRIVVKSRGHGITCATQPDCPHELWIWDDLQTTRLTYRQKYPADTNWQSRAWRFMVTKLVRKMGDAVLSPQARKRFYA